ARTAALPVVARRPSRSHPSPPPRDSSISVSSAFYFPPFLASVSRLRASRSSRLPCKRSSLARLRSTSGEGLRLPSRYRRNAEDDRPVLLASSSTATAAACRASATKRWTLFMCHEICDIPPFPASTRSARSGSPLESLPLPGFLGRSPRRTRG